MNRPQAATISLVTTDSQPGSGVQPIEPPLLDVREAAKQLGKSTSTVYRIDRAHGPFRFVMKGRCVFIDAASLDAYITSKRRTDNDSIAEEARTGLQTSSEDEEHLRDLLRKNGISSAPVVAEQADIDPPASGCGQRDLIVPQHAQPFVVFYFA